MLSQDRLKICRGLGIGWRGHVAYLSTQCQSLLMKIHLQKRQTLGLRRRLRFGSRGCSERTALCRSRPQRRSLARVLLVGQSGGAHEKSKQWLSREAHFRVGTISYRLQIGTMSYRLLVGTMCYRLQVGTVSYRLLIGTMSHRLLIGTMSY